ncbi:hypothetical protein S83_038260, partial [Arachis hypogaea]
MFNIALTRFASTIVILKRFRLLKQGLKEMLINEKWSSYKEDNIVKADIDTDALTLYLVHEIWDSMIKKVKSAIYLYERKDEQESCSSTMLWTKNNTPLHCLAHSLNPREDLTQVSPYQNIEITNERVKCLKRYFPDEEERRKVNIEFASFSDGRCIFDDYDSLNDRSI